MIFNFRKLLVFPPVLWTLRNAAGMLLNANSKIIVDLGRLRLAQWQ